MNSHSKQKKIKELCFAGQSLSVAFLHSKGLYGVSRGANFPSFINGEIVGDGGSNSVNQVSAHLKWPDPQMIAIWRVVK